MPQTAKTIKELLIATYNRLTGSPHELLSQKELFDKQIETLVRKGLAQYADADPFRNRIPEKGLFLFVPAPPKELDLDELMGKVKIDGRTGVNYLDARYLKDIGEYPTTASLLVDVEDGRRRLYTCPLISRQDIESEKRHPYNTWRGIIHVNVFPANSILNCNISFGKISVRRYPYQPIYRDVTYPIHAR